MDSAPTSAQSVYLEHDWVLVQGLQSLVQDFQYGSPGLAVLQSLVQGLQYCSPGLAVLSPGLALLQS